MVYVCRSGLAAENILSLALSTYLSFLCMVRAMDYFLAELIAKMGERLLAMQAPCGDQPRGWQA